jgi:hypothetical protein
MAQIVDQIVAQFSPVIGLKLSIARNAGTMKVFHFGEPRAHPNGGTMGLFALHIQCPWRIVSNNRIITGSADYWYPGDPNIPLRNWKAGGAEPSLQEKRLLELFQGYDPQTQSCENITELLDVESVKADVYGGVEIQLSGGYLLQIVPVSGTEDPDDEIWRLFQPYGAHFIARANGAFDRQGGENE